MNHTAFGYARWFDFFCSSANIFSVFLGVPNFYPVNAACCCGNIKTDEPRTLDFSGVRGFLVTNVCIVQRSAA